MPINEYTSPGSYSWTAPFATKNVTATCIGGGGSGHKDDDDNEAGGGGGGGGFAKSTRSVPGGTVISITVGDGGNQPGNGSSNDGEDSRVSGGSLIVIANGGEGGRDGQGGNGRGGTGDTVGIGEDGQDDADSGSEGGRGGGAGKPGGNAGGCGGRPLGGQGVTLDGTNGSCTGGRNGGLYGGGGGGNSNGGEAGQGGKGAVRIEWDYHPPQINTFTASNQTSSTGTPSRTITLTWATTYANSISINQGVGGVGTGGTSNIDSGLQSVAGSNSPAQKTYTITATGPGGTVTATATASVYNDNTPSNSWTTSFINLEPNTQYSLPLGQLQGVDMPTIGSAGGSGNAVGKSVNGPFGNPLTFFNNEGVYLRFTSMPFNTTVPSSGTFGLTNSKTIPVTIGSQSFDITVTTRAPRIAEDFNYVDKKGEYPYQDIDVIINDPTQYLNTAIVTADDIDIPVEIKASDPGVQVNINGTGWQNVRSI
jgi:hypothetical protein